MAPEVVLDGSGNPVDLRNGNRRGLLAPLPDGIRPFQDYLRRQIDLVQEKGRRFSRCENPQATRQG